MYLLYTESKLQNRRFFCCLNLRYKLLKWALTHRTLYWAEKRLRFYWAPAPYCVKGQKGWWTSWRKLGQEERTSGAKMSSMVFRISERTCKNCERLLLTTCSKPSRRLGTTMPKPERGFSSLVTKSEAPKETQMWSDVGRTSPSCKCKLYDYNINAEGRQCKPSHVNMSKLYHNQSNLVLITRGGRKDEIDLTSWGELLREEPHIRLN